MSCILTDSIDCSVSRRLFVRSVFFACTALCRASCPKYTAPGSQKQSKALVRPVSMKHHQPPEPGHVPGVHARASCCSPWRSTRSRRGNSCQAYGKSRSLSGSRPKACQKSVSRLPVSLNACLQSPSGSRTQKKGTCPRTFGEADTLKNLGHGSEADSRTVRLSAPDRPFSEKTRQEP